MTFADMCLASIQILIASAKQRMALSYVTLADAINHLAGQMQ
jgi:hypothetical protein